MQQFPLIQEVDARVTGTDYDIHDIIYGIISGGIDWGSVVDVQFLVEEVFAPRSTAQRLLGCCKDSLAKVVVMWNFIFPQYAVHKIQMGNC